MHVQQNWKIGLGLSLLVVFFWSTLPVALNISLSAIDAWTLTWLRFSVAAVLTLIVILMTGSWKALFKLSLKDWLWLLLAGSMLICNYVGFIIGLEKTTPANAQVLIQLAPLLMILGGVFVFKEKFKLIQKFGTVLLVLGLILFFNDQIHNILKAEYLQGVYILIFAAVTWAVYALIQKKLHAVLSPQVILTTIYILASVVLLPFAHLDHFSKINSDQWWAISYACFNTIGAYAAFAQALKFWQASRVGMVIAMVPVFTLLFINLMSSLFSNLVQSEHINTLGFAGVVLSFQDLLLQA